MPNAAPAAGTGTPVSGNHENAMELSAPVEETTELDTPADDLGSHLTDDPAPGTDDASDEIPEADIPVRLRGKSLKDIYQEFSGLEANHSRLGNELGEARQLLRLTLEQELQKQGDGKGSDEPDVTDEDFDASPREATARAVKKAIKPLEQALATAEQKTMMAEFNGRHPGYQQEVRTPEFQQWVMASPMRQRMFKAAAEFDLEVAEELFTEWGAAKKAAAPADGEPTVAEAKKEAIRRNRTETGGAGRSTAGKSGKKVYSSIALTRLYTTDRAAYNEILRADPTMFSEKRVR